MNRLKFVKQQREKFPELIKYTISTSIPSWVVADSVSIDKNVFFSERGFGYEWYEEKWLSIPHVGSLFIGKDVEIFSGTNIVRPTLKDAYIGAGTKIDYNCHIAHNVNIGKHCLIVAGTIIGGSVTIGNNCFLGIGCMIKNKIKIGNNVTIGMGAVVINNISDGETVIGNPARKYKR